MEDEFNFILEALELRKKTINELSAELKKNSDEATNLNDRVLFLRLALIAENMLTLDLTQIGLYRMVSQLQAASKNSELPILREQLQNIKSQLAGRKKLDTLLKKTIQQQMKWMNENK